MKTILCYSKFIINSQETNRLPAVQQSMRFVIEFGRRVRTHPAGSPAWLSADRFFEVFCYELTILNSLHRKRWREFLYFSDKQMGAALIQNNRGSRRRAAQSINAP